MLLSACVASEPLQDPFIVLTEPHARVRADEDITHPGDRRMLAIPLPFPLRQHRETGALHRPAHTDTKPLRSSFAGRLSRPNIPQSSVISDIHSHKKVPLFANYPLCPILPALQFLGLNLLIQQTSSSWVEMDSQTHSL